MAIKWLSISPNSVRRGLASTKDFNIYSFAPKILGGGAFAPWNSMGGQVPSLPPLNTPLVGRVNACHLPGVIFLSETYLPVGWLIGRSAKISKNMEGIWIPMLLSEHFIGQVSIYRFIFETSRLICRWARMFTRQFRFFFTVKLVFRPYKRNTSLMYQISGWGSSTNDLVSLKYKE